MENGDTAIVDVAESQAASNPTSPTFQPREVPWSPRWKLAKLVVLETQTVPSSPLRPLTFQRTMVALFMEAELSLLETRNQTLSLQDLLFAQAREL